MVREAVMLIAAVFILPFKTIRALIWKWYFWIEKVENQIQDDHDQHYNNQSPIKNN
jgi:hypothetical protein